ncbi:MAG: site-specific integrase [Dehalococcoidia bacterium]|jgi:integrase|nr:site-specific integrase [Dehalococcoidia bacterium]
MRGSVSQRYKGSWQLRYDGPPDASGNRRQVNETVRGTRKDAERLLRERIHAIDNGGFLPKDKETLSQFLEKWLDTYVATNCAPRTLMDYRGYVRRYVTTALGSKPIQQVTARDIQQLYADMLVRLSPKTVLHLHRVLREAFKHAVKWGVLIRNVADATTPPHPRAKQVEVWDAPTINRFLEIARSSPYCHLYRCAVLTGMRRSELAGLRWEAVDLENSRLSVVATRIRITGHGVMVGQPKTARSRRLIALSPDTVALLREVRVTQLLQEATHNGAWKPSGYVFVNAYGNPVNPDDLSDDFHRLVVKSGLPHLTLHGLRHAHATLLLSAGVHAKVVSERLGHSTVGITLDVYSHVLPHVQEEAANKIDAELQRVSHLV